MLQRTGFVTLIVASAILTFIAAPCRADNWPQWRGPSHNGLSAEKGLPTQWSKTENVVWRLPMPGQGGATPVIWEDAIFVTSAKSQDIVLMCIGTDGKIRWEHLIDKGDSSYRTDEGNDASPSPCTDGQHVWAMSSKGTLVCCNMAGKEVWRADLSKTYGPFEIQFGMSSTPVLHEGNLYLQLLHGSMRTNDPADKSFVVCLNAKSGQEVWKHFRESEAVRENKHSYASPTLYQDDQRTYLLIHGGDYITAHNLSDGSEIWRCGGMNPATSQGNYNPFLRFVASPTAVPGMIVVPTAKRGAVLCLKPDQTGLITEKQDAYYWKHDRGTPDVPSPLIVGKYVYLCSENGDHKCVDAKSGEVLYEVRANRRLRHRASPVYGDGKIYFASRDEGIVTVVAEGPEHKVLATNAMNESLSASPAISNGRLYLRTFDALYCISNEASQP